MTPQTRSYLPQGKSTPWRSARGIHLTRHKVAAKRRLRTEAWNRRSDQVRMDDSEGQYAQKTTITIVCRWIGFSDHRAAVTGKRRLFSCFQDTW